jgi:hypothetical protein
MKPTYEELVEALMDAAAHLTAAASSYENFVGNASRSGKRDPFYTTRLSDYQKAAARASGICRRVRRGDRRGKPMARYSLCQDDSGHWYLIESQYRREFYAWLDAESNEPFPHIMKRLDGPYRLTFESPIEE